MLSDLMVRQAKATGKQVTRADLKQIGRVFKKDIFPALRHLTIYDITRAHLPDIIGKVEKRGPLSVAEKLRTWFTRLFTYATVAIPNMGEDPSKDSEMVALPLQGIPQQD